MARRSAAVRHIAFLRGINVGGHRVKMEDLRAHFTSLGFTGVETFIASGNVIFDTTLTDRGKLESRIEDCLQSALGYEVATFVRTPAELAAVAAHVPFDPVETARPGHTLTVGFLRAPFEPDDLARLLAARTELDELHHHGREIYWLCRGKTSDSLMPWPQLIRAVKTSWTMRNMTTVRKMAGIYSEG